MTLVALANALLGDRMVERFHADPRVQATELLLQERVPRRPPIIQPRPVEETRAAAPVVTTAVRRFRSPHTRFPHAQFLSNGNYVAVVTNAGGGASFCRGRAVTRCRDDATCDPGSQFVYLRDVRSGARVVGDVPADVRRSRRTTSSPSWPRRPRSGAATTTSARSSTSRSRPKTTSRCAGSSVTNHSDRVREIDVTSYVEIVLAPPADDLAHPAFGKLFVETEYLPESAALLCRRRPRGPGRGGGVGGARAEPRRPAAGAARMGDRSRAVPRPRAQPRRPAGARRPRALRHHGRGARSDRSACGSASASRRARSSGCPSRPGWRRAAKRRWRSRTSTASRAPRRAPSRWPTRTRRARCGTSASPPTRRCSSSASRRACSYADGSLRAPAGAARAQRARPGGPLAVRHLRRPADPPRARRRGGRPPARAAGAAGAGVLAAQGADRRCRDPQRAPGQLPRRDARAAHRPARRRAVARVEAPAGRRLPAARRPHGRGERILLASGGAGGAQRRPRRARAPSSIGPTERLAAPTSRSALVPTRPAPRPPPRPGTTPTTCRRSSSATGSAASRTRAGPT